MVMNRDYTNKRYLEAVLERVIIFDGAMGTGLQSKNLTAEHYGGERYLGCFDYLVISYPQAVEDIHRSYLEVGVDVVQTNTFRANSITLNDYGLGERVIEINSSAASLARQLADEYSATGHQRFVAGSIGPSGMLPSADDPDLSNISFDELEAVFCQQALGLIKGGVDLILIETSQDILEMKAVISGIMKSFNESGVFLPIQAQFTLDTSGRMLLGTTVSAALTILECLPIDVIGLNCSTGPEHMRQPIEYLGNHATLPISCIPNAGLPINVNGEAVYPLEAEPFSEALVKFVETHHINIVGGCCGTTPAHMKRLVEKLRDSPQSRRQGILRTAHDEPRLASAINSLTMHQDPPPLLIGERCNAQGSRKFKRLLMVEDYDAILALAQQQVERGAHALDISVAVTERSDEVDLMRAVVILLSMGVDAPLVIDTTEPDVMEAALKTAPGRCLLNSTHLESGREKADQVFALAKKHNSAVLCLTIDESGMAKTSQRKFGVAKRLFDIAINEHGLRPQDLVFDALTFTLATGDAEFADSAVETMEGIRLIKKELPGVMTSLGVSNVSFGFNPAARRVLNSVMLYQSVQAGLDMAIVNPALITPYTEVDEDERNLVEDLLFNSREDALIRFIEYFEQVDPETRPVDSFQDPLEGMIAEERLHWRILHRKKDGVEADIDEIIAKRKQGSQHKTAVFILNGVLLPAMKEVGDKFGAGELILPFVLQSAEVMNASVNYVEGFLEKIESTRKGLVVLATVYGDVHDIGKNLVKTILSNNGYDVIDMGKQVPSETIISKALEVNADAIGLSALLVSTSKQMPLIVNDLHRRGSKIPVLIGGAAINRRFGRHILLTEEGSVYQPGVFYCKDAFEGLATMEALIDPDARPRLIERVQQESLVEIERRSNLPKKPRSGGASSVSLLGDIPKPPFWGARVVDEMALDDVTRYLDKRELFRLSWGAKNTRGEEWIRLEAEFERRLESMKRTAILGGWLKPQGVYGYWPAQSSGDNLIIYDPASIEVGSPVEIQRFQFPRQPASDRLCLADYFLPVNYGQMDVAAFQVVTVGLDASVKYDDLQSHGDYSEAYYFHGMAVQSAEATAEYLHRFIRKELGLNENRGKRYSWGYPAVPELEDHRKVFSLLPAEDELGMSLTEAYQLIPEQSTAAIVVHHPEAKYFNLGSRYQPAP